MFFGYYFLLSLLALRYYLLMSVFHENMKKWDREGMKEFNFYKKKKNNYGTLSWIPTPSTDEFKEKV
jgi:hypothetical protein